MVINQFLRRFIRKDGAMETLLRVRDDRTLIARKTTIVGDIMSSEPLSIEGIVDGDVKTESVVGITGHVNGDIEALKVQIAGKNAHIKGTVMTYDTTDIFEGAAVIGDVIAYGDVSVSGLIKGNVSSDSIVNVADTAYIAGNVSAKKVNIADGSKIRGMVELKLSKDSFDEEAVLAEVEKKANEQLAIRKQIQESNIIDVLEQINVSNSYHSDEDVQNQVAN